MGALGGLAVPFVTVVGVVDTGVADTGVLVPVALTLLLLPVVYPLFEGKDVPLLAEDEDDVQNPAPYVS